MFSYSLFSPAGFGAIPICILIIFFRFLKSLLMDRQKIIKMLLLYHSEVPHSFCMLSFNINLCFVFFVVQPGSLIQWRTSKGPTLHYVQWSMVTTENHTGQTLPPIPCPAPHSPSSHLPTPVEADIEGEENCGRYSMCFTCSISAVTTIGPVFSMTIYMHYPNTYISARIIPPTFSTNSISNDPRIR